MRAKADMSEAAGEVRFMPSADMVKRWAEPRGALGERCWFISPHRDYEPGSYIETIMSVLTPS